MALVHVAKTGDVVPRDLGPGQLREVLPAVMAPHRAIRRLILFGSRARGDSYPGSDYDFYAELDATESYRSYLDAVSALEAYLQSPVDIVTGALDPATDYKLAFGIRRDGVMVYDRDAQ